jgi:hypothetical protein
MKRGLQQVVTSSALFILLVLGGPALAGFYNITKVVTWDIDKLVNGAHTPNPGPMKLILFGHSFNNDNHPGGIYHIDNVPVFPLAPGNPYTDSIVTNLAFQQPVKTDHAIGRLLVIPRRMSPVLGAQVGHLAPTSSRERTSQRTLQSVLAGRLRRRSRRRADAIS